MHIRVVVLLSTIHCFRSRSYFIFLRFNSINVSIHLSLNKKTGFRPPYGYFLNDTMSSPFLVSLGSQTSLQFASLLNRTLTAFSVSSKYSISHWINSSTMGLENLISKIHFSTFKILFSLP